MDITRTIESHLPPDYDDAALRALNWVNETGGTLLFLLPRDKNRSLEYFKKHATETGSAHIEVVHGDNFSLWGPRIAAISVDDLGRSRIERDLESESVCSPVEEMRSYARKPDKHPKWTQRYDPDSFSATM